VIEEARMIGAYFNIVRDFAKSQVLAVFFMSVGFALFGLSFFVYLPWEFESVLLVFSATALMLGTAISGRYFLAGGKATLGAVLISAAIATVSIAMTTVAVLTLLSGPFVEARRPDLISSDPPKSMQEGLTVTVDAIVAKGLSKEAIESELRFLEEQLPPDNAVDRPPPDTREVKLLPILTAKLLGIGFRIEPSDSVSKSLVNGQAEWHWQIRPDEIANQSPLSSGSDNRVLTLQVVGQRDTNKQKQDIFLRSYPVRITPTPGSVWAAVVAWLKDVNWIWATLVVPLLGGITLILKRPSRDAKAEAASRQGL
jgi:hypothetical protein